MTNETTGFNSIVIKPEPTGPDAPGSGSPDAANETKTQPDQIQQIPTDQEAPPAETGKTERPAWLPEKFKSAEDLAAAYGELEKKLSGKQDASATETSANMESALNSYADEYSRSGALSEKSYGELAKLGMPKKVVDAYIAGQQAIGAKLQNDVYGAAGGKDAYIEMIQWASSSLSKGEIAAYNEAISSGDTAKMTLAVRGLSASFAASGGVVSPKVRIEGKAGAQSVQPFRSRAELTEAMSSPKYKRDPAYRADVEARLAKSNIF